MKQIPLLQGKALLIELPEGANSAQDSHANGFIYKLPDGYVESWYADEDGALDGNWRLIGMLDDVTEEQAASIAEEVRVTNQRTRGFKTYTSDIYGNEGYFESAIKSLESAILAEGYGFDSEPEPSYSDCEQYENPMRTYDGRLREWNYKQSRVLDRSRCLLLGREI